MLKHNSRCRIPGGGTGDDTKSVLNAACKDKQHKNYFCTNLKHARQITCCSSFTEATVFSGGILQIISTHFDALLCIF